MYLSSAPVRVGDTLQRGIPPLQLPLLLSMASGTVSKKLLHRIKWFNLSVLTITPIIGLYGLRTTPLLPYTLVWAALYYVISMLGEFPFYTKH